MSDISSLNRLKVSIDKLVDESVSRGIVEDMDPSDPGQAMGAYLDIVGKIEKKLIEAKFTRAAELEKKFEEQKLDRGVEDIEEFAVIYSRMALANKLFLPSYCIADNDKTLVLMPHCLTRAGCEKYDPPELEDLYCLCNRCSKCPIDLVNDVAESNNYHAENVVILGGDDGIGDLLKAKEHNAIAGFACPKHIRGFLDFYETIYKRTGNIKPLRIGMLEKGGCKNTVLNPKEIRKVLLPQKTSYKEARYDGQRILSIR